MKQAPTHFDKVEVADDIERIIVYLECQTSMMHDKFSEKYNRMKSIIASIKKMRIVYDEIYRDNLIYLNALLQNGYFTEKQIDEMFIREKNPSSRLPLKISYEDALGLLSSVKKVAPEPFDINKHSHLIQKK